LYRPRRCAVPAPRGSAVGQEGFYPGPRGPTFTTPVVMDEYSPPSLSKGRGQGNPSVRRKYRETGSGTMLQTGGENYKTVSREAKIRREDEGGVNGGRDPYRG